MNSIMSMDKVGPFTKILVASIWKSLEILKYLLLKLNLNGSIKYLDITESEICSQIENPDVDYCCTEHSLLYQPNISDKIPKVIVEKGI